MKKTALYFLTALLLCSPLLFTSCDDDDDSDVAKTLEGTWHGVISTDYYYTNYGYNNWETEFRFLNYGNADYTSPSGEGIEIDYDPYNWSNYRYYEFRYEVAYGNIYLHFSDGGELVIRSYRLTDNRLYGDLETTDGQYQATLSLQRTSYWPWSTYAKATRSAADSTATKRVFPAR